MEISNPPLQIHRNWLDLPRDVTLTIMEKLDVSEKLESAQFVCKMWYILCKEPSLWRTIRTDSHPTKMVHSAVDRSNGGLIELDIGGFCTTQLLSYALSRSSQLKRLRLVASFSSKLFSVKKLKEELEKLSSLEELVLTFSFVPNQLDIIPVISSCRLLTGFGLNMITYNRAFSYEACGDVALAIAASMPNLRHLHLRGNSMTNVGLTAILDGCPLLESLDLRDCYKLDLAGNLGKRLVETIKDLRLPKLRNDMVYFDDYDDIPEVDIVSESDYDIPYNNAFNDGYF